MHGLLLAVIHALTLAKSVSLGLVSHFLRFAAGMADNNRCPFSLLPKHACEALLLQAWQQLNQHHRFGIIPCVCSSWYHLSLPTFTSLEVALRSQESIQQFSTWLKRHGSTLQHLSVDTLQLGTSYDRPLLLDTLGSINNCKSLTSLHLIGWNGTILFSEQLLAQVTSLTVRWHIDMNFDYSQLYRKDMQQLRALDLHGTEGYHSSEEVEVHQLLSALPNLTSLDLIDTHIPFHHLASCSNLPQLKELKLGMNCFSGLISNLAALEKLPCTSWSVSIWGDDAMQERFKTWSVAQHGRNCLGRLTSMQCTMCGVPSSPGCPMSHAALFLAEAAGQLKHLALEHGTVGVDKLALLTGLTQLTSLQIDYDARAPDADVVTPLAALSNLQQLTVSGLSEGQAAAVRAAADAGQLPCLKDLKVVKAWFYLMI
jgi:hypothetical protein